MPSINLDTKVGCLTGVGPKIAVKLNKLGIETVSDLIFYYPRDYIDFLNITKIGAIANNRSLDRITIKGTIIGIQNKKTSRRRFTVTEAMVEDETGSIKVIWFNQPFLTKMLTVGREVILNGKIEYNFFSKEVVMESPERALKPCMVPIYSKTAGLTSKYISKLVSSIKDQVSGIEEFLPNNVLEKNSLSGIQDALINIQQPKSYEILERARRRIAFDELFFIALRANLSKLELKKENAPEIRVDENLITNFIKNLPYELTGDQDEAVRQILKDIENTIPMNRLLNGDVGSGKTVVAAIAAYAAINSGYNVALMAPTEILANQHFQTFKELFSSSEVGLFTASKKEFSEETRIFIGTHALIQKSLELKNLGLVIVDEQHRFGVKQRGVLLEIKTDQKNRPHFLSMTATPIPRTLHLALFGDLELSVIKEKPKDRKEIKTKFVEPQNRNKAYAFIRAHIKAGRQAFVICPLIESKECEGAEGVEFEDERKTVKQEYEKLKNIFSEFKIGMLHGKMPATARSRSKSGKSESKDEIMKDFAENKINILVSTSVVEVGIDIPNATVMMVEDAERFGLSQLHQFRGRVGRGEHQSFCLLFSSTMSPQALKRLHSLEMTSDGFRLAEIDLEQRGPGAVFGTEQSGILDLKMANFSNSILIEEASSAAKLVVESDPDLKNHLLLKEKISDYMQNKHLE